MKKYIWGLLLCLSMVFMAKPVTAFADDNEKYAITVQPQSGSATTDRGYAFSFAATDDSMYLVMLWSPSYNSWVTVSYENGTTGVINYSPDYCEDGVTRCKLFASDGHNPVFSDEFTVTWTDIVNPAYDCNITVTGADENGTTTGSGIYSSTSTVTITAIPKEGYVFAFWTDQYGCVVEGVGATYSFTPSRDMTYTAWFEKDPNALYTIETSTSDENGTVSGGGTYKVGTTVTLTATANKGYIFDHWTDRYGAIVEDAGAAYSFTVSRDMEYTAWFIKDPNALYTITATSADENGTVSGGGTYKVGTTVTLTATAKEGYVFDYWTDQYGAIVKDAGAAYSFTVSQDMEYAAWFKADPNAKFNITVGTADNNGTVTGGGTYTTGTEITITATANPGYVFDYWTDKYGCVVEGAGANYRFKVTTDMEYSAWFKAGEASTESDIEVKPTETKPTETTPTQIAPTDTASSENDEKDAGEKKTIRIIILFGVITVVSVAAAITGTVIFMKKKSLK